MLGKSRAKTHATERRKDRGSGTRSPARKSRHKAAWAKQSIGETRAVLSGRFAFHVRSAISRLMRDATRVATLFRARPAACRNIVPGDFQLFPATREMTSIDSRQRGKRENRENHENFTGG